MIKKVLVTGAGGYIGRFVVKELCDLGFDVIASNLFPDGIDIRAKVITDDIFSLGEYAFDKLGKPDVCLHLAWRDGFVHNSNAHMEDISKHYEFVENMIKGGLHQFCGMGSMHEIGYYEGVIDENTPCNPMSQYGIAKNALRQSLELLCKQNDVNFQWIRGYYIYGDDIKSHSIFAKICQAAEDGKHTFPLNSGKNKYDFIHVGELARQIVAVITQNRILGVINCCSGIPLSLGEMVEKFIKEHGFDMSPEYGVYPDRPYDSPAVWGSSEKIDLIMRK